MLALPLISVESEGTSNIFSATIKEPELIEVSRDLFASGHYSFAVQEAYKALDKFVSTKSKLQQSGSQLMNQAFSPNNPVLSWTARLSTSEQDEQKGYHQLYAGAMLGIRNPTTHEFKWVDDVNIALELLIFAQHLMRKAKAAKLTQDV